MLCSSRPGTIPFGASHLQDFGSPLVSRRPPSAPSKHCQRCIRSVSESARCTAVRDANSSYLGATNLQGSGSPFRVRDPFLAVRKDRSRASAQMSFISSSCPGQHRRLRPSLPPCSSLRISFVKNSCRSITGWRLHSLCSRSPMQRHDVESVASAGASPAASTIIGLQALK